MASRIHSPFHSTHQARMEMASADHRPWRTVRRTSRTACWRRPFSVAMRAEAALITPMPKMSRAKCRFAARAPAATASGPIRPIIRTSVVVMPVWAMLVRISGQASASVERTSSTHAPRVPAAGTVMSLMGALLQAPTRASHPRTRYPPRRGRHDTAEAWPWGDLAFSRLGLGQAWPWGEPVREAWWAAWSRSAARRRRLLRPPAPGP